ncbi:putative late blight resistance protein homolog R1A-3 isoform X2 [Salvia miltiorrhiza]|uniref:putative late blight resistance protein homolog R1A-3 isoform X2 n=1 Tax=Salvia miltiorrhiza TaxID=226208 RepID=UPI0025AB7AE8|nr:putative late blight resistance protein homolog R1A-3 isoform X2 [Salvia miltiorrhiza]
MDKSESSSRQTLSEMFQHLHKWRNTRKTKRRDPLKFKWSQFHLSVVHGYVLKLKLSPDSKLLRLATSLNHEFSGLVPENSAEYDGRVASLAHALEEVFVVPEQHQLFERDEAVERDGLIAALMDMLLRLLHNRPGSVHSVEDRIEHLRKLLRFLLAVLGHDQQGGHDLLTEFETVANKAGSLVHLIVFSAEPDSISKSAEKGFGALLRRMEDLKSRIIKRRGVTEADATRKTAAAGDSLFIVDSLVDDLGDLLSRVGIADVKDQVATLQHELRLSSSLLKDSRLPQHVMQLRDAAYEAEYLINSFLVGNGDVSCRYFSISLARVIRNVKSLQSGHRGSEKNVDACVSRFGQLSIQNKSSSSVEDVIGFEDKELEILQYLDGGSENLQIVALSGMPGVVSHKHQMRNVLIEILVNLKIVLDKEEMLNLGEESLKTVIHQILFKRRYLIVMDDIWSTEAWDGLQACFPDNGNGSRILLTSRNRRVAPPHSMVCELPLMSNKHCWKLLRKKVFQDKPFPPNLKKIAKRIARSCRGLPLAVVVTAGILSGMNNHESTWREVEGNLASYMHAVENNLMMQIVELSYANLADHLKPCFLYFGVFQQGEQILVAELLRLWIAEGFVRRQGTKRPESVAENYLMDLMDRNLVTAARSRLDGGVKECVVHDLLHEFCLKRCEEENLHTLVDKDYSINKTQQRLCIRDFVSSPRSPLFGLHVRSILGCFPTSGFLNMKLLRVLLLQGLVSHGSLNEIKHLYNLRCLSIGYGLSSPTLELLKLAFLSSLVNLEFLQVKSQFYLVCTPSAMAEMVKLRYIDVSTQLSFGEESCSGSQPDNNLEFLSNVVIRDVNDESVLKCSPNLRELKCKCFPLVSEETGELRYPDFAFFTQLELLHLEGGFVNAIADISLPSNVKELTLSGLYLPWEKISVIGGLQSLQKLKLLFGAFDGEVWETREGDFQQLRLLMLKTVYDLREWEVESWEHFPRLRWLVLDDCQHLQKIPAAVGDIATLEVVEIKGYCQETLMESAQEIEKQQREEGNEELKFNLHKIIGLTSETASSFFLSLLN